MDKESIEEYLSSHGEDNKKHVKTNLDNFNLFKRTFPNDIDDTLYKGVEDFKLLKEILELKNIWAEKQSNLNKRKKELQEVNKEFSEFMKKHSTELESNNFLSVAYLRAIKCYETCFDMKVKIDQIEGDNIILNCLFGNPDDAQNIPIKFVISKKTRKITSFDSSQLCNAKQEEELQRRFQATKDSILLFSTLRKIWGKRFIADYY